MSHSDILKVKGGNYRIIVEAAAKKLGLNTNSFVRMAAIEKANYILNKDGGDNKFS